MNGSCVFLSLATGDVIRPLDLMKTEILVDWNDNRATHKVKAKLRPNPHWRRGDGMRRANATATSSSCFEWGVHTGRKQHQRNCPQICVQCGLGQKHVSNVCQELENFVKQSVTFSLHRRASQWGSFRPHAHQTRREKRSKIWTCKSYCSNRTVHTAGNEQPMMQQAT